MTNGNENSELYEREQQLERGRKKKRGLTSRTPPYLRTRLACWSVRTSQTACQYVNVCVCVCRNVCVCVCLCVRVWEREVCGQVCVHSRYLHVDISNICEMKKRTDRQQSQVINLKSSI
jgi:hypothetical protein